MLIVADELGSERLDANGTSEQEPTGELIAEFGKEEENKRKKKSRTVPRGGKGGEEWTDAV